MTDNTPIIFQGSDAFMINKGGLKFNDGTKILTGAGTPEGAVTAPIGSKYLDTTNGVCFIKNTGVGNTGWIQNASLSDLPSAVQDDFTPTLAQTVFTLS